MPMAVVKAAFDARYVEFRGNDPPLYDAITVSDVPEDDAFVVIQFPLVTGEQPVLQRHFVEEGAARLVLNVRREAYEEVAAYEVADDLARIYRLQKFAGVETFTPSSPIVNDTSDDGNWFSLSVIVRYRYQFYDPAQ